MKKKFGFLTLGLLFGSCLHGQDAPKADVFIGYSYLRANPARSGSFPNDGGVGALGLNLNNYFGVEFEFGGYYNGNVNKRGVESKSMTYLIGPRVSFGRSKGIDPYFHLLVGGIYVSGTKFVAPSGTNPTSSGTTIGVSEHNFAMATGGGVDIQLTKYLLLRPIQLDYLLTRLEDLGFSGQPTENRNQHNLRASAGLVFQFGGSR
jgi:hypothetical protein